MHWIKKYRKEHRLSRDALAEKVIKAKIDKHQVGCSGKLIDILEYGGITHPNIAAVITMVCGGTAEDFDSIVHEDYRGKWKPGQKLMFESRYNDIPDEFTILTAEQKAKREEEKRTEKTEVKPPKAVEKYFIKPVVKIGRDGTEEMRFASMSEAAAHANVGLITVSLRCNKKISDKTDEFKAAKCTWRFANEWDAMTEEQRAKEVKRAKKRIREERET